MNWSFNHDLSSNRVQPRGCGMESDFHIAEQMMNLEVWQDKVGWSSLRKSSKEWNGWQCVEEGNEAEGVEIPKSTA